MQIVEKDLEHCPEVNKMVNDAKAFQEKQRRSGDHQDMEMCKDLARHMVNQEKGFITTTSNYDSPSEKLFRNMSREQRIAEGWVEQRDGSWVKR